MAQGFVDFGKGVVDMFGTGGAAIGDLIEGARTGKVTTKNQDDFRKWLYQTDSTKDAAAKGLGTTLNGVQTVLDYIPGVNVLTRNPLGNAAQGALGGLADEFKTYGEDYDLGRAGQRAAVSAAGAAASGSLADALKGSSNALLSSNAVQGLARGATGGAITGGGYAAIDGGDVLEAAKQGAGMGALIGGATGAFQDFRPAKAYDVALTDEEKAARIKNAQNMLANEQNPERIAELNNQIKDLGGTLADADMAVNSPRYLTDENGNPRTFYHGSPNKDITEFDINQAGKNTSSGERALYFTDSPEVADDFSYERLPSDSMFVNNRGAKGRVYPVNLEMNNPLDLDNLTDAQIRELWQYASPLGQLDGQEKFIKNLTEFRDAAHNGQLTKTLLDLDKLAGSQYDGFTARMYPNQDNQAREYAVFDNSKVKMLEDVLANDDMAVNSPKLTPEQEAYFKDSVIRDENGNLIPLYHGSNSKFTVFDSSKGGQSNKTAKVGHWFTPSEEGARNFANSVWYGDESEPTVYSTYLNVKNPKIYEAVDNSAQIKALNNEMDGLQRQLDGMRRGSDDFNATYKKYNDLAKQIENLSYGDPYEQFRSDIYAMEGKTPYQANVGGLGMMMDDENAATQKYVQNLRDQGYDGIIIRGTNYDNGTLGGVNDQYVVFDSNQIKDINNLRPTSDVDIMASRMTPEELDLARALADQDLSVNSAKIAPGQLGLFDDMPTQTPKTGTRQTSLFDQPDNPYLDYYGADIDATPLTPEAPVISGPVDMSVEDLTKIAIDESTLPKGWKKAQELANMGKRAKQIVLDPNDPNRARNEYNVALYSDAQYGRNMPVADVIDKLGQIQYGREIDRGAARLLADQLDESGDEFAKKFVTGAAEAGGNISHYRDAPKAKLADEQLSSLLNIGRSNSMLSDSLANPSSRNARGDQWKGTINLDGKSIAKGSDGGISTFGHERLHAFQDAGNMGYDQRVVDAYNELHDDLSKIYHSDSQIRKDYGSDVKYWSKPIEQEARMAQFYLEDKFGVKGAQRVPERDANGKAIRYKDDGTIADPNNLLDYYTGKPAYKGEFEGDRKAINAAFDKFRGKLQDLTRKGVALPAFLTLLGGGAYMASQENDKEKEVK